MREVDTLLALFQFGRTALMEAAGHGHADVVETLLTANSHLNATDKVRHISV